MAAISRATPLAFDRELALDRAELFAFLRDSQPKTWAKLEGLLGAQTEATVLDNLLGALAARGSLDVLRHGFKCYGKQLDLAYFAPAHGMNPATRRSTSRTASPSPASSSTASQTRTRSTWSSASTACRSSPPS